MKNQVQVIDNISGSILYASSIDDIEKTYALCLELENEGLDIRIESQSLPETLIRSLNGTNEEVFEFKKSLEDEIMSHNESCISCL